MLFFLKLEVGGCQDLTLKLHTCPNCTHILYNHLWFLKSVEMYLAAILLSNLWPLLRFHKCIASVQGSVRIMLYN